MQITNLENDGKLIIYEGTKDKADVEALVEGGYLKTPRYDKFNLITSNRRCCRPGWSLVLFKDRNPSLWRLKKDALRRVKVSTEDIPLEGIEFKKNGAEIVQPMSVSDGYNLRDLIVYVPANTTELVTITWESSNTDVITVNNSGVVSIVSNSDDPVTITATAKEGISATLSVLPEVTVTLVPPEIEINQNSGEVTITCATTGAEIYYSTDNTDPSSGTKYVNPFTVNPGTTVKAVSKLNGVISDAVSETYEVTPIEVATPTIQITDGLVTMECTTADSVIYYTIDNSTPDKTSTLYENSFQLTDSATVKAIAYVDDYASEVASESWVKPAPGQVATPSITPASGAYTIGTSIEISCSTDEAVIHYTTDGSNPSSSSPTYSSAITLEDDMTVKAIGIKDGMTDSNIASVAYTIAQVATPLISPADSSVVYGSQISISMLNPDGETIHYTTDGSNPDENSPVYSDSFQVNQENSFTVKAIAFKANYKPSAIAEKVYTVTLPKLGSPTFSVESGAVTIGTQVEITAPLGSGASVKYKVGSGTEYIDYTGPITINEATTVSAISVKEHCENSDPATATYTIAQVATPTATPDGGTIAQGGTVTLNCSTTGATIYYTNDGSAPSSSSTEYTTPIVINVATTIKAIAVMANMTDSDVMIKEFAVDLPDCATPTFSQAAGEIPKGTQVTIASDTVGADIYYTNDGSVPTTSSTLYSGAITVNSAVTLKAIAVKSGFDNSAVATVAYTVPQVATPVIQPSETSHTGSVEVTITCESGATIHYTDDGTTPDENSTTYSGPITIAATSSNVTKTIQAIAVKSGSIDSEIASKTYTVAKPATTLYRYAGCYNMHDNGDEDVDPAYQLSPSTISTLITDTAWLEANVYNTANPAKMTADTKSIGTSSEEVAFTSNSDALLGFQIVYAYPANLGELTVITNSQQISTNSFSHTTLNLDGEDYLIYYLTDPTGMEDYTLNYSFN